MENDGSWEGAIEKLEGAIHVLDMDGGDGTISWMSMAPDGRSEVIELDRDQAQVLVDRMRAEPPPAASA